MLMAAMRLNIPTIFASGGPMEAGDFDGKGIDLIEIDIPVWTINLLLSDPDIAARLAAQKDFEPAGRERMVPKSLQAYARFVSSADQSRPHSITHKFLLFISFFV